MKSVKLSKKYFLRKFTKKKTIQEDVLTIEECYRIADEILDELFSKKKEEQDQSYQIMTETAHKVEQINKGIEEIKQYIEKTTGIKVSNYDVTKLLNKDDNRRELTIDEYMKKINTVMNQLKVIRRNSDKPMMTARTKIFLSLGKKTHSEAHLTTRGIHQEQVEKLAEEIAEDIGLNVGLAGTGARHHDDGHTSSGHAGERMAATIGILSNCGYIVHNALSADILISEGVIPKILQAIERKEGTLTEERKEQIIDEIWNILDIPISHNGEGKDRVIYFNPKKTREQIIEDKNRCYTEKGYDKKIVPGSKEAALVVFADRICYVRTDILDGVNLGILKEFNEKYLQYIGILAAKRNKNDKLIMMADDVFAKEEQIENEIKQYLDLEKTEKIDLKKMDIVQVKKILDSYSQEERKIILEKFREYKKNKADVRKILEASAKYGQAYVAEIPIEKRAEMVADMIKDVTAEDLKQYSRGKDYIGLSPAVAKAFFGIRSENLEQIVKYTRRKYERELLPKAELKVHEDLKNALLDTGIIRQYLQEKNGEEVTPRTESEEKTKKKFGLKESELTLKSRAKTIDGKHTATTKLKEKAKYRKKYRFERKICHNFMKMYKYTPERLEEIYKNALKAVEDITRVEVEIATGKTVLTEDDILYEERMKKVEPIAKDIVKKYPKGFSKEEEKNYVASLADIRRNDKEEIFASAVALEYVAGMADSTLLEASMLKRYLTFLQLIKGNERGAKPEQAVQSMQNDWNGTDSFEMIIDNIIDSKER